MKRLLGGSLFTIAASMIAISCIKPTISQKEKNTFIQWYINKYKPGGLSDTLEKNNPDGTLDQVFKAVDKSNILNASDKEFMRQQILFNNKIKYLSRSDFKNVDWITKDNHEHTHLSLPMFSRDKHIVIIYQAHYCGNLCGDWGLHAFRWQNGNWVELHLNLPYLVS